jgi:hypothetical protein
MSSGNAAWYTPVQEGYRMTKQEQFEIYLGLKKDCKDIQNEIASLEAYMKKAGEHFAALAERLKGCQLVHISWGLCEKMISDLPSKAGRYQELQATKADKESQLAKFTEFN